MNSAKENMIVAKSFVNSLKNKEDFVIDNFFKKHNLSLDLKEELKEQLNEINILQETKTFQIYQIAVINKLQEYFFKVTFIGDTLNKVDGFLCDLNSKKVVTLTNIEAKYNFKYLTDSLNKEDKVIEKETLYNEEVANAKFNYFFELQKNDSNENEEGNEL